jgi:hypothetical protein
MKPRRDFVPAVISTQVQVPPDNRTTRDDAMSAKLPAQPIKVVQATVLETFTHM